MKHRFLIFGFLITCSTYLHGQDNILISSKQVPNSAEKTNEILRRNVTYTSVDFVDINLDKILEYKDFSLQLGERKISIRNDDDITYSPILRAAAHDCKIRVLVLYTQNAISSPSVSNIKNTILTAVAFTNQSFINSQINYQIELVYAGLTNYTESGFSTDLSRFRNIGDGYMDEVHSLRDKYSADVCVLLNNDTTYCGLAPGNGVTENKAFCVVSTIGTCATTNYSFGHEIGHLLGCDHDPLNESYYTPFAYGHGYVNPSKTWRTIMAYKPENINHCPRLLYWSNPNVYYNGVPMGTTATQNNARVWNERSNIVMAFRQPDNMFLIFQQGLIF